MMRVRFPSSAPRDVARHPGHPDPHVGFGCRGLGSLGSPGRRDLGSLRIASGAAVKLWLRPADRAEGKEPSKRRCRHSLERCRVTLAMQPLRLPPPTGLVRFCPSSRKQTSRSSIHRTMSGKGSRRRSRRGQHRREANRDRATSRASTVVEYSIDGNDVVVSVGQSWADFARDNHAPELVVPPSNRTLWTYFESDEVKELWRLLVERVRAVAAER